MTNEHIKFVPINTIKVPTSTRNTNAYSPAQIETLAQAMQRLSYTLPVLLDKNNQLLAGYGYLQAMDTLELKQVPTLCPSDLDSAQKLSYVVASHKFSVDANFDWDLDELEATELKKLGFPVAPDLSETGVDMHGASQMMVELDLA